MLVVSARYGTALELTTPVCVVVRCDVVGGGTKGNAGGGVAEGKHTIVVGGITVRAVDLGTSSTPAVVFPDPLVVILTPSIVLDTWLSTSGVNVTTQFDKKNY